MFVFEVEFTELKAPKSTANVMLNLVGKVNSEPWADFGPGVIFVEGVQGKRTIPGITPVRYIAMLYCRIDVSGTADTLLGIPFYSRESFDWLPEPSRTRWIPDSFIDVQIRSLDL